MNGKILVFMLLATYATCAGDFWKGMYLNSMQTLDPTKFKYIHYTTVSDEILRMKIRVQGNQSLVIGVAKNSSDVNNNNTAWYRVQLNEQSNAIETKSCVSEGADKDLKCEDQDPKIWRLRTSDSYYIRKPNADNDDDLIWIVELDADISSDKNAPISVGDNQIVFLAGPDKTITKLPATGLTIADYRKIVITKSGKIGTGSDGIGLGPTPIGWVNYEAANILSYISAVGLLIFASLF